jgi:hypothetical protein
MKIIAHRGLIDGSRNTTLENHPDTIKKALDMGFDVEIDVWYKNGWFLGHDEPQYSIDFEYLNNPKFWIHAKNIPAMEQLLYNTREHDPHNFFWHQNDDITLTSKRYIWAYPGQDLTPISVCVMPEQYMNLQHVFLLSCYGICTDFAIVVDKICNGEK